jgi:hypothetical protein
MAIKSVPDEQDGRTLNSALGQRNRGQMTRMSIDLTKEEQKEFLMEAVEHNMTLRGYFYHCWRQSQHAEGIDSRTLNIQDTDGASLAEQTLAKVKGRQVAGA